MKAYNKLQQGFTLIELMIVVAIIGILAAIAVPQYQKYVAKSEAAAALASITAHRTNVEMYVVENGAFPQDTNDLNIPSTTSGEISYGQAASGAAGTGSGTIIFTFAASGASPSVVSKLVTLQRDGNGTWTCSSTIEANDLKPKGCK
ncbi:pilin [Vibrio misgurnus]|uniref:pilin n=1 Tax=Vibrio misgurnus TaxID=2993714 RepID=UPI002415E0CC|nr:pilin [Vibrio sp. gvc]